MSKEKISIEECLIDEIERRDKLDPQHYYNGKLPSIRHAQKMGISDDIIEEVFNIKIAPEDRQS